MNALVTAPPGLSRQRIYQALDQPRHRGYPDRRQHVRPKAEPATAVAPRRLTAEQDQAILDALHSERFIDASPRQVYARLLSEGTVLCATTMPVSTGSVLKTGIEPKPERTNRATHTASRLTMAPTLFKGRVGTHRPPGVSLARCRLEYSVFCTSPRFESQGFRCLWWNLFRFPPPPPIPTRSTRTGWPFLVDL